MKRGQGQVTSSNIFKVNKGNFSQLLNVTYAGYEASWRRPKLFHFEANEANLQPVNNNKVIEFLKNKNFKILKLSKYSISDQVSIFHNCKKIIAPHGAGLAKIKTCNFKYIILFNIIKTFYV